MASSSENLPTAPSRSGSAKANPLSHVVLGIMVALVVIPFVYLLSISFSDERDLATYGFEILPRQFTLEAYRWIFDSSSQLVDAYWVSIQISVVGVGAGMLMMSMAATAIARPDYRLRKPVMLFFMFTMMFNGGVVPEFIVMTRVLGLYDSLLALIMPLTVRAWFLFLLKSYLEGLPFTLIESAKIDGASEFRIYRSIVLPLSTPGLAAVGLLLFMTYWNDWVRARLFIASADKVPLQYWMMRVMENVNFLLSQSASGQYVGDISDLNIPTQAARMAMAVLAAGPALFIFPFFQRYFTKGIQVGAIKG